MKTLTVSGAVFDALAAGDGAIVGPLRSGLRSKRLLLLHRVATTAESVAPEVFARADAKEAFDALVEAQRCDRSAADDVLLRPHVGAWAMACLRRLSSDDRRLPDEDLGHFGGIAAAAALRAGCPFEVTAYVRDRTVVLPTYGAAQVPVPDGWCRLRGGPDLEGVEIGVLGETYTVPIHATSDTETWRPLRRLRATSNDITFDVPLEDLDPYRGCGHLPIAPRLDAETAAAWQSTLEAAWPLLVEDDRERAEALAQGITSIVPLLATDAATELSASCHEAVGAVAMTQPFNPLGMALALVHEHQHNKLSALLDLVPLLTPSTDAHHRAPWRPDPRPLRGLIQGTYAFFGLTRFWESVRRNSRAWDPEAAEEWAHFEFALGRLQATTAVETLLASGHLNENGERFLGRMSDELARLGVLRVPPIAEQQAELVAADHAIAWRLRNCRPADTQVDGWATARAKDENCVWQAVPNVAIADGGGRIASTTRQALVRHRLAHPDSWKRRVGGVSDGDVALVANGRKRAAKLYEQQIRQDPADHASWAGLALARRGRRSAAAWALTRHPELVYALHRAERNQGGEPPSATAVAHWLGRSGRRAERCSRCIELVRSLTIGEKLIKYSTRPRSILRNLRRDKQKEAAGTMP